MRIQAGTPTLVDLESQDPAWLNHSTVSDLLTGKGTRIPDWERIPAFVTACVRIGNTRNLTMPPEETLLAQWRHRHEALALSVLDEHFTAKWQALGPEWTRSKRIRNGAAAYKLVRYADDFVVLVTGTRADADARWGEVAAVLAPMGLRLSAQKSRVCHIDEGFDFLGFRIQRRIKPGTTKRYVYTWPSKKSLNSVTDKVRKLTRRRNHKHSPTCSSRSTPYSGDGANISSTACPNAPSSTSTTSPSGGS